MFSKSRFPFLLLGIGIGVIFTNIIYTFFPNTEYREYTEAEIIEKATEMGMVFVKDSIELSKKGEEQVKEVILEDVEEKTESKEVLEELDDRERIEEVEIEVVYGDSLIKVARKLHQAGIIDNIDEFVQFAKNKGVDRKLRVGIFKLSPGLDYETIIKILLKKQQY
ncbi:MAG: endolytic transglycosylase MltG [Tissierellia bacterium]|nr:endolytic transglycosylase MltG [Tissierellia bacterium]